VIYAKWLPFAFYIIGSLAFLAGSVVSLIQIWGKS